MNGCPPDGKCQVKGYPYSSWIVLISMIGIIFSMPFVSGQSSGLVVGIIMVISYSIIYMVVKAYKSSKRSNNYRSNKILNNKGYQSIIPAEFSKELAEDINKPDEDKKK